MKPIPLSIPSLFAKAVFSKPPQELLLVALGQQEKKQLWRHKALHCNRGWGWCNKAITKYSVKS